MSGAKNDIWMAFYTADYLKDTTRLNTLAHGAYILLLIDYWTTGKPLPDNDDDLAAITRMPLKDWLKMRPTLARMPFFNVADGVWTQKRADEEIAKRAGISQERSGAGKVGAEARWGKRKVKQTDGNAIANAIGQPLANPKQTDAQSQSQSQDERTSLSSTRDPDAKKIRFDQIRAALNTDPDDTSWQAINGWCDAWLVRGADFNADILATVMMMMAKKPKNWTPRTLSYFDTTIQENFDARVRRAELPAPKSSLPPAEFNPELEKWRLRVDAFYSSGTWSPTWGPTPDELGCHAPASVRKARAA